MLTYTWENKLLTPVTHHQSPGRMNKNILDKVLETSFLSEVKCNHTLLTTSEVAFTKF